METKSIMIVGVGGQGSLLASRLLGNVLLAQGFDVKVSEVHGMSQRGGSVVTYVKYGDKVYSPVIEKGEADAVISFELLEAARCLPYLKKGGHLITSTQQIDPMPVITGAAEYPENLVEKLRAAGAELVAVDALYPFDVLLLHLVFQVIADEEEFRFGVVHDVVDIVHREILQDWDDDRSVG